MVKNVVQIKTAQLAKIVAVVNIALKKVVLVEFVKNKYMKLKYGISVQELEQATSKLAKALQGLNTSNKEFQQAISIASKRIEQRLKIKKRFALGLFLIGSFLQAQNISYITSLNSLNLDQAKSTAEAIANSTDTKYELLKISESEENFIMQMEFVPIGLTAAEKEEYSKHPLTVRFSTSNVGENKDLQIKGVKTFRLKEVKGKYLEVAPYWIKTFYPKETNETVLSNYDLKSFKDNLIKYMLQKNNETWKIINIST
jgi:hypothetical protein